MIAIPAYSQGRSDWPMFGHDSASTRFSPLKQITPKNIGKLKLAWSFDTTAEMPDSSRPSAATPARPTQGRPRVRQSKTTPIVVGDVMFLSTPYNRVVALNAETGAKIWEYVLPFSPASRGISYWPGSGGAAPRIF